MSRTSGYNQRKRDRDPVGEVRPCVQDGEKCTNGCGATLKGSFMRISHVCDLKATSKSAMRGDRRERSSVA
jgi:hypothetical protein